MIKRMNIHLIALVKPNNYSKLILKSVKNKTREP